MLQQNWLYIKRKKKLSATTIKLCKLASFNAIVTLSFVRNVIMKTKIFNGSTHINVLKLLKVYNATQDRYSLWAYCVFIQVSMYLQQKT